MNGGAPDARASRIAWVLNFDADDELASPSGYPAPSAAMRARLDVLARSVEGLVEAGDVVVVDGVAIVEAASYVGRAWCPTPTALARMRAAGVAVPRAPTLDVLRRVNHRRFCAELGQALPGATFAASADECAELLARRPPGETWLLKRAFGFAGRGRRKVTTGALGTHDALWLEASLRVGGGVQVEPWIDIERDFAIHGEIDEAGAFTLGLPTMQRCDEHGAWVGTRLAAPGDLSDDEDAALGREARVVAAALVAAGYFGPFGVDAYRWRDRGVLRFNARGEVNARYTMGWGVGMSTRRSSGD